ncbi:MAG: FAD-binding protein [Candidatus Marinimicrobia bacterium]|nr:FAD-binding protein [Candidatus Neomarinimicrobiota bacterium]
MNQSGIQDQLEQLQQRFDGDIFIDEPTRLMYATDASAYREVPLAVTRPKTKKDIHTLIEFATNNQTSLIPRAAGTSLAGQVVGDGIIVDISKYWTRILEVSQDEHWVRVEPGVNLDELNLYLKLHGYCQQKAIASTDSTKQMLAFPENYTVEEIPSGCCGMAGAFGFEKEHYDVSMKVGELVLFPAVRVTLPDTIIAAPGTSCRQQIKDGTGRDVLHPVEIIYDALI